ncbi:TolC family protein, partial [Vibrio metoecus]|uniref:TolC family protein n=1 Tax=Vibrio metoecus TaxID=1481663 RepID=UPI00215CE50A
EANEQEFLDNMKKKEKYGLVATRELEQAQLLKNKIDSERKIIESQIKQFENNIELITSSRFPSEGVGVDIEWINSLINDNNSGEKRFDLSRNIKIAQLNEQINMARLSIKQANSVVTIGMEATQKYYENSPELRENDSYVGVNVSIDVFNLTSISDEKSKVRVYEMELLKKDDTLNSLASDLKKLDLEYFADFEKLKDLKTQEDLNEKIIKSYERDYEL